MNSPAEVLEFINSLDSEEVRDALSADPVGAAEIESRAEDERLREALFDVLDGRPAFFRQLREDTAARDAQELAQMWLPLGKGAL